MRPSSYAREFRELRDGAPWVQYCSPVSRRTAIAYARLKAKHAGHKWYFRARNVETGEVAWSSEQEAKDGNG